MTSFEKPIIPPVAGSLCRNTCITHGCCSCDIAYQRKQQEKVMSKLIAFPHFTGISAEAIASEILCGSSNTNTVPVYGHMVSVLFKDPEELLAQLTPQMVDLWHAGTGVAGEGGELLDAVKKYAVYNKPVDRTNIIEELGDLEFYMEAVRQNLGITREETLVHNVQKLAKRYGSGTYSDQQAQQRADKSDEEHY